MSFSERMLPLWIFSRWQDKAECQTPMILQAYAVKGYQRTFVLYFLLSVTFIKFNAISDSTFQSFR